jgi:hypothetical protein
MSGWIKLHRRFLNWEWYDQPDTVRLFIHLLLRANHEKMYWHGMDINPGQMVTGRLKLAEELNMTDRKIRTSLNRLKSTNEIAIKTTNKYSIITICKWDNYQSEKTAERPAERPAERLSNDQQSTTNKNDKNDKKKRNNISLLSKVDESTLDHKTKKYYQVAISFYELIKSNLKELNISNSEIEKAKYKTWIEPIRLLIEKDGRTIEEFREIFQFLQKDDFWKEQIRSTAKLRKKNKEDISYFEVLLTKSRNEQKRKEKRESSEQEKQSGVSDDYRKSILNRLLNPQNSEAT